MKNNETLKPLPKNIYQDGEMLFTKDVGSIAEIQLMGTFDNKDNRLLLSALRERYNAYDELKAENERLENELEEQMLVSQQDIQNWIIALQSFKNICVGRGYEKHIIDGMMRLIGSYPKNEWFEEKEKELLEDFSQAKELTE